MIIEADFALISRANGEVYREKYGSDNGNAPRGRPVPANEVSLRYRQMDNDCTIVHHSPARVWLSAIASVAVALDGFRRVLSVAEDRSDHFPHRDETRKFTHHPSSSRLS